MTAQLRLYSKQGCHLCEDALAALKRLGRRQQFAVELVDITDDASLMSRYGARIPVLSVDGYEYDAPLDDAVLRQALRQAKAVDAR